MLKIAYGNQWKTINPGIQHTLVGDLVIGNQFESLVGLDDNGAVAPLGAKSWTVSKDFTEFKFLIDTNKTFSNGIHLAAQHYKDSWERSAKMDPASHNSSSLDVLYMIEGFEDLKNSGHINGLKVVSDSELVIKFKKPYRMALEHLEGNRFAAYIEENGKYLGTGRYLISELGLDHIQYDLNLKSNYDIKNISTKIDVTVAGGNTALSKLESGEIDAMAYGIGTNLPQILPKNIGVIVGQDAIRHCLQLNSNRNRIFESKENRTAFQYIMYKIFMSNPDFLGNPDYNKSDFQLYLELQSGRIPKEEVINIIFEGEKNVAAFLEQTKKHPLFIYTPNNTKLQELLKNFGVAVSEKSGVAPGENYFQLMYKSIEPDIFMSGFSVAYGDPDGIYHKLGRNGAIATAMVVPGKIADLLEEGRELYDAEKVNLFYQNLNREFLRQVPIIHLGYSKAIALYRNDKVQVSSSILKRNEGLLHIFEGL